VACQPGIEQRDCDLFEEATPISEPPVVIKVSRSARKELNARKEVGESFADVVDRLLGLNITSTPLTCAVGPDGQITGEIEYPKNGDGGVINSHITVVKNDYNIEFMADIQPPHTTMSDGTAISKFLSIGDMRFVPHGGK